MPDVPPFLWGDSGTFTAPKTYEVSGAGEVQPYSATATFDGTGASGAFLAALSFYSDSGNLLSRVFPGTPVQAGDVAQVSYAPFPGGLIRHLTGPGIQYDFLNVGAWLSIETTGSGPAGVGTHFTDAQGILFEPLNFVIDTTLFGPGQFSWAGLDFDLTGTGSRVENFAGQSAADANTTDYNGSYTLRAFGQLSIFDMDNSGDINLKSQADTLIQPTAGNATVRVPTAKTFTVRDDVNAKVFEATASDEIGFFGVGPAAQQATPVTLGDVIALLQAYGLSA